jgi:hypothetical protein
MQDATLATGFSRNARVAQNVAVPM